ncbi:MAG: nucleotide-binding protein [Polyangiales bacterium]
MIAVFVSACGGGGGQAGPQDKGDGGNMLSCDVPSLFTNTCGSAGCHNDSNPAGGLDLISANVESRVTLVNAQDCFGLLADPSDPEESLLYIKLLDEPGCGLRMPYGGDPLPQHDIDCVRDWISGLQPPKPIKDGGTIDEDGGDGGEGCPGCECTPGKKESCYDDLQSKVGVASCAAGMRTCQQTGLWGLCEDQVLPSVENCHETEDEDCSGADRSTCTNSWVIGYGVARNQLVESVGTDSSGNVYVLGSFEGTLDFGTGPLVAPGIGDENENNVFLAKYDQYGAPIWAHQWGDTSNQLAAQLAVDGAGNTAFLVRTRGTMNFGGSDLTTAGDSDIIVARFDADGNHVWSKIFGGSMLDRAERIAFDADGNVLVAGKFTGSISFTGLGSRTANGITDGLLLKLAAANGNIVFALPLSGPGDDDYAFGVDADAAGNVYVTGHFSDTMTFGTSPSPTTLTTAGGRDIFVAKLDPSGNFLWAKGYGGTGDDRAYDLVVHRGSGDVILTGYFENSLTFGNGGDTLTSAGGRDFFVARLDSSGAHVWSAGYGDATDQMGVTESGDPYSSTKWMSIALDGSGNIFFGGPIWGSADFNLMSPGGTGLLGATGTSGNADPFWVKLTGGGAFLAGGVYGKTGTEIAQDVATTPSGHVLLGGRFYGTGIDFGTAGMVFGATGDAEGFVAKIPLL